jgi:hypothetical protein
LEQVLDDASIDLSAVASSLSTVSSQAMVPATVAGPRDPAVLAELARGTMGGKLSALGEVLDGWWPDAAAPGPG